MPSKKQQNTDRATTLDAQRSSASTWVVLALFILALVVAASWFFWHKRQQRDEMLAQLAAEQALRDKLAVFNEQAGLPEDYPATFVPLYPGVEIVSAEQTDADSTDGAPMDRWHVLAQIDEDKEPIYEFYKQRMENEDMRQTMYISLPTGYSMHYADENRIAELRIEKTSKDELMQVELTVYVVKGAKASKAPFQLGTTSAQPEGQATSNPPA